MSALIDQAKELRRQIEAGSKFYPDELALTAQNLFTGWDANGVSYAVDDRVRYNGLLYRCLVAHVSQSTWNPRDAGSLWAQVQSDED